jgi:hypothetical protein
MARNMNKNRWIVSGCFAIALALPVQAFDNLDQIKAELANCRNCPHRTLLQARLNYRLKIVQQGELAVASIAGSVPGTSSGARQAMAGAAGSMASNAGGGVGGNVRGPADNTPLRGQTAMSAYVSVYGTSEVNAAELRLSIEEQFRQLGINVLPHTAPPGFPVFNLTIKETPNSHPDTVTGYDPTRPAGQRETRKSITVQTVTYEITAELRRLIPGTTTANNPIRDEAIWKIASSGDVGQVTSIAIADEAVKLAIHFVDAWASVNPQRPAIAFKPRAPIVPGPPPETNHPEIVLLHETIQGIRRGSVDSVYDVHASQRDMVEKQLSDLMAAGQKVLTCQYGPRQTQSTQGFKDYDFWYPAPPADVLKYMLSTYGHPFMRLGLISLTKCPPTAAGAEQLFRQRFN